MPVPIANRKPSSTQPAALADVLQRLRRRIRAPYRSEPPRAENISSIRKASAASEAKRDAGEPEPAMATIQRGRADALGAGAPTAGSEPRRGSSWRGDTSHPAQRGQDRRTVDHAGRCAGGSPERVAPGGRVLERRQHRRGPPRTAAPGPWPARTSAHACTRPSGAPPTDTARHGRVQVLVTQSATGGSDVASPASTLRREVGRRLTAARCACSTAPGPGVAVESRLGRERQRFAGQHRARPSTL